MAEDAAAIRAQALEHCGQLFDDADTNGDGTLDRAEMIGQASAQFSGSEEEKQAEIDAILAQFDTDGDGKISKAEWLDFFGKLFDALIEKGMEMNKP